MSAVCVLCFKCVFWWIQLPVQLQFADLADAVIPEQGSNSEDESNEVC